jgi:hypothetical protein
VGTLGFFLAAAVLTGAWIRRGSAGLLGGDATEFHVVAEDPFANGSALRAHQAYLGDAYRYGRMLYPFLAWLLALGHSHWTLFTLALLNAIGVGVCTAIMAEWCMRRGRPAQWGLAVLIVPALSQGMGDLYSEPVVIALILIVITLWLGERHLPAIAVAAALLLAREAAALALVPLVADSLRRANRKELIGWIAAALPYLGWAAWVRHRVGAWPFLEKSVSARQALGFPGVAYVTVVRQGLNATLLAGVVVLGVVSLATVVAALYVIYRVRNVASWAALFMSVYIVCQGQQTVRFASDAFRIMGPTQLLLAVAWLSRGPADESVTRQ